MTQVPSSPGSDPSRPLDVIVIGGGISGLAAAHRLLELQEENGSRLAVKILEAADRLGGHVRSETDGDCLYEAGPDSIVTQKPAGLDLCRRLGLENSVLSPLGAGTGTWILRRGRLLPLPDGLLLVAPTRILPLLSSPLISPLGKLRALAEPWIPARREGDDESVGGFVRRRFGEEMSRQIAEPLLGGLYTADVDRLSVNAAAPRLVELERRFGSLTRGLRQAMAARSATTGAPPPAQVSLEGGMETLIEGLRRRLPSTWIETSAAVSELSHTGPTWRVTLHDGRSFETAAVVLAIPTWAGAAALRSAAPELAQVLDRLDYASCATASLVYPGADATASPGGFGFFVPRDAGLPILACSFANRKFAGRAPQHLLLLRVFLGGALHPRALDDSDEKLLEQAHDSVAGLLGIRQRPLAQRLFRMPRAMPQFNLGEPERRAQVARRLEDLPGLFLAGSAVGAFGLPDCIRAGEDAALAARTWLARADGSVAQLQGLTA